MAEHEFSGRFTFRDTEETFEVDCSHMSFTSPAQVDAFYDEVDRLLAARGRQWYFLVDYTGCAVTPAAWERFTERGKQANAAHSQGTVRIGATAQMREAMREHAENTAFRPNICNTRDQALQALDDMRGKRRSLHTTTVRSTLFVRLFSATTGAIVALFAAMYFLSVPFIQDTVENIEEHTARTVLDGVCETLDNIQVDLQDYRQSIILARKMELESIIAVVESRAAWLARQARAGKLSPARAKQAFLEELRNIQYGNKDYVWASDYQSVLISHPDPKLNNADFSAQKDVHGRLIVPPMVEGARKNGAGFHSYWWRRLGDEQPIEKLSFYKHIPAFDLVIGTGLYMDDIEALVKTRRVAAIENLRQRLKTTRLAKTGYVYIFDGRGNVHVHPNANIDGKNIATMIEPSSGKPLIPMLIAVADKPEGLRYRWDSPDDPGNYAHEKISWVRHSSNFDWYVGSSVYTDELSAGARTLGNRMLQVFSLTVLLSIALVYVFVKRLTDPLRALSATAQRVQEGDLDARCALARNDEIGVVAAAFNGMIGRLQDNIEHLDAKVRQRTAELEQANEELKELDKLKSDFLSTVSHELRTPMTSIVGFVKLVRRKLDDVVFPKVVGDEKTERAIAQVRENLDIVIGENDRLTLLINDVLDSAKLVSGEMRWHFVELTPDHLIERTQAVTATLARQKGLELVREVEPGLPCIRGDENRLLQVLINLVSNAIKFTERGRITLGARRHGACVRFHVRDNGIGIAAEDHAKVFDKFKQIGDTLTEKPQGTGLGLSICQQIVQQHGGEIWLDSSPGTGATFYFTVPETQHP